MAGTISVMSGIIQANGTQSVPIGAKSIDIVQTGQVVFTDTLLVATTATTIATGSIGTLGVAMLENLDTVRTIKVGQSTGGSPAEVYPITLKPGERYPVRFTPGITPKAISLVAAAKLQVTIYED